MNRLLTCASFGLLVSSLLACGGGIQGSGGDQDNGGDPPPVNTHFALRVDGKAIDLEAPRGAHYIPMTGPTYVNVSAERPRGGGDYGQVAEVTLHQPFAAGTFDCTPNERGEVVDKQAALGVKSFLFNATLTDCVVTVQYIAADRVVGTFSVNGHAPEGSSLSGTVSKAEGDFDVPLKETRL